MTKSTTLSPLELPPSTQQNAKKVYWKEGAEGLFVAQTFCPFSGKDNTWDGCPEKLCFSAQSVPIMPARTTLERPHSRVDTPNPLEWERIVQRALLAIEHKKLEKVVLARKTTLTFEHDLDPLAILGTLSAHTVFAVQLNSSCTFLGATPEVLFRREGKTLFTHALAGTQIAQALFTEKEAQEHKLTEMFLQQQLEQLCTTHACSSVNFEQHGHLHHLSSHISGHLKPHTTDHNILSTLHPTPATCGYPQKKALDFIQEYESFERGYYAGPIGWLSSEKAEVAVGIRCALIKKNQMHLFAGAGIVKGSDPEQEWNELEQKIAQFLCLTKE